MAEAKARNNAKIKNEKVDVWVKLLAVVFIIIALIAVIYRLYTIPNPCGVAYVLPEISVKCINTSCGYCVIITRVYYDVPKNREYELLNLQIKNIKYRYDKDYRTFSGNLSTLLIMGNIDVQYIDSDENNKLSKSDVLFVNFTVQSLILYHKQTGDMLVDITF